MSKQPSDRAYGLARGCLRNERDIINLALAIDSVISTAREDAYKKAAFECERIWKESPNERPHYRQSAIADGCIESAAAIRALAAQEAIRAIANEDEDDDDDTWHDEWESHEFGAK